MITRKDFERHIFILEDGASSEKVCDIEKIVVRDLFEI